jgi:molecular chaperone DnaK (HSP70)
MAKLGIDLGTSNSCAAIVFDIDPKNPVTITPIDDLFHDDPVYPSYVAFNQEGEFLFAGLPARNRFFEKGRSGLVVRHFKRLLGRSYDYVMEKISENDRSFLEFQGRIKRSDNGMILFTIGEKDISVEKVTSYLLKKIIDEAQNFAQKRGESIELVTMSVPTGLDVKQRQATIEAAKLAGLDESKIQVVEEPTAAAIARGLKGAEGETLVINVGAGTTDVIIGYLSSTKDGFQALMPNQDCDDLLGGMDMDDEVRKYILKNDSILPRLADAYDDMADGERLRLMGKIEDAKIIASRDGYSQVSIALDLKDGNIKRINIPLEEQSLAAIFTPILNGYKNNNNLIKGIRPVIERTLLKSTGGNLETVPKVISELKWLILIGGPCRMKCLHEMLKDIFKENKIITTQIDNLKGTEKFIKEGVAQGAALYDKTDLEVISSVPWTVSIYHRDGSKPIIHAGTTYNNGLGIERKVSIPAIKGSSEFWILNQKDSKQIINDWEMYSHLVNVPEEGQIEFTLKWDVDGFKTHQLKAKVCGSEINFPEVKNTTLGNELEGMFAWYLKLAKDLRGIIEASREPWSRYLISRGFTATDAEARTREFLEVSGSDIVQAGTINPETEKRLTPEDIKIALESGFTEIRKQVTIKRGLLSPQAIYALDGALAILLEQPESTIQEIISESNKLLNLSKNCSSCIQYWQQLTSLLHRLELEPNNLAVRSAVVTALAALADCLSGQSVVTEEELSHVKGICWRSGGEK